MENEENIFEIEENMYQRFKYSIEELQRFFINALKEEPKNANASTFYTIPQCIPSDSQNRNAVGIDLGTSRCCLAVNRRDGIKIVALENTGERLLPSYVGYDEMHTKCGQVVIDRIRNYASSTVFDSKRLIGKTMTVIDKIWPFKVITDDDKIYIKLDTPHGEIRQTATEVAAVLLQYIKIKAEEFQGKKLEKVVLTVPAAFSLAQEEATREAAILAGWKTVMLLPEPIAASFAYFIDRPISNNSLLLLFDLGGGTLDVCVFKIANNQIEIISKNGDSKLGGRDFDNLLMDYFLNILHLDFNVSKLGNKKYKLLLECQKIKHNLSVRDLDQ
uniref:Heat shock protein 70 n=1 Tax=Panagrolaimus davidi TaxID=227884 RepID=A0A914QQ17_9BILA